MHDLRRSGSYILIILQIVVFLLGTARFTLSSPLYGGYNGESESWVEVYLIEENTIGFSLKISLGGDPHLNMTWSRISISSLFLLPYLYNLEFSYETGGVVSAGFTTLMPWPTKYGADTNNLRWIITNFILKVRGQDTNGTLWEETGIPGLHLYATGWDNKDHRWEWIKVLSILWGWRNGSLLQPSPSEGGNYVSDEGKLVSFLAYCMTTYAPRLSSLLVDKLRDDGFSEQLQALNGKIESGLFAPSEPFGTMQLEAPLVITDADVTTLLHYIEEGVFTQEIRNEMEDLLSSFMEDFHSWFDALTSTTP